MEWNQLKIEERSKNLIANSSAMKLYGKPNKSYIDEVRDFHNKEIPKVGSVLVCR